MPTWWKATLLIRSNSIRSWQFCIMLGFKTGAYLWKAPRSSYEYFLFHEWYKISKWDFLGGGVFFLFSFTWRNCLDIIWFGLRFRNFLLFLGHSVGVCIFSISRPWPRELLRIDAFHSYVTYSHDSITG